MSEGIRGEMMRLQGESSRGRGERDHRGWAWHVLAMSLLHVLGTAVIFALIVAWVLPMAHLEMIAGLRGVSMISDALYMQGGQLLFLSALVWAAVFVIGTQLRKRRKLKVARVVSSTKGTAVTEFLIILPVLLLLIFGLAQLSINLIGGLLHRVAQYQAVRAAWVWEGEETGGRATGLLEQRASTAVALVMTPVANGNAGDLGLIFGDGDLDESGKNVRILMANRFFSVPGVTIPRALGDLEPVIAFVNNFSQGQSFATALDNTPFAARAVLKYSHAFASVQGMSVDVGDEISISYTYHHYQAMPYVGKFFGGLQSNMPGGGDVVTDRPGYFVQWGGSSSLPRQRCQDDAHRCNANPNLP